MSGAKAQIRFETAPDLISGIELTTNGRKIAWSIADYLTSLIKGVDDLLQKQEQPPTKPKPKPKPAKKTTAKARSKTTPKSKTQSKSKPKHDEPGTVAKPQ
jgi:F-type H+-transporting ATPase subunit b